MPTCAAPTRTLLLALFTLALPAARGVAAQGVGRAPALPAAAQGCRGERDQERLTTTVVFGDGYAAQARWKVLDYARHARAPGRMANVELEIQTAVEGSEAVGWREHTRFERPLRLRLVRTALEEVAGSASESWCRTVETMRLLNPAASLAGLLRAT